MSATTTFRGGETFLGKYQAVRLLGEGGMGRVFLGRDLVSGHDVVIKVMHEQRARDPRGRSAFQREMQVMMRFRHPYAVALLDGSVAGQPCLIMEYVRGITLEEKLQEHGQLEVNLVGRLLGQLCQVLQAAHDLGIWHRDLKTENLMVMQNPEQHEHIKVLDFGLAHLGGDGFFLSLEQLTGRGHSIGGGTPDYLCPEQIRGEMVDQRGDLYSVGVVLFKLLTGQLPFGDVEDIDDIFLAHVRRQPPSFRGLGTLTVPAPVEAVVRGCLAKDPRARPQSARELAALFGKALGHPIADDKDFTHETLAPGERGTEHAQGPQPVGLVLDRFEAWMPEQVALMKLRGFIEGVGGEVADSVAGLIRVRLRDPRARPKPQAGGFLAMLGLGHRTLPDPGLLLDLWMEKKQAGPRSLVEITVAFPEEAERATQLEPPEDSMRIGFGERICRELRAYLMIGR